MKRENFYRRDPGAALAGMANMTLEERGVYNTIIDLLYLTWRPLEDNRAYIAGHCGCAVQKLNPIIARLIEKRKLVRFEEDGQTYLSNPKFEDERTAVKGPSDTRSGRASAGKKVPHVEEKSGEVGEKSAGVEKNPPICRDEPQEIQPVTPLDKSRVDKTELTLLSPDGDQPSPKSKYPELFERAWRSYPHVTGRSSKPKALASWKRLSPEQREALPAAAARFAKEGREPKADCGAPGMHLWIRDEKFADWTGGQPSIAPTMASIPKFPNAAIRGYVVKAKGEPWAVSYLDTCAFAEVGGVRTIWAPPTSAKAQVSR